jgi:hypothetical protein
METPISDLSLVLRIHQPSDEDVVSVDIMELDEQRQQIENQIQTEEFWAGRTLGDRKSTRIAA